MKLKNTFGYSVEIAKLNFDDNGNFREFGGSSLDRKNALTGTRKKHKLTIKDMIEQQSLINSGGLESFKLGTLSAEISDYNKSSISEPIEVVHHETKERSMSRRTKTKIRKKIIAWSQVEKKLFFVTLTFLNKVEDEPAVNILRKFLDNVKKRKRGFQYLWVAERQKKNTVFPDNIHFHLITNKAFDIKKYLKYWIALQNKNGVFPRDEKFNPSSAFDIKAINATNINRIRMYLTKYVTKNEDSFKCQVWNCSKMVSALYTDYYTYAPFLENFKKLENITTKQSEFGTIHLIPLNQRTLKLYSKIDEKNLLIIKSIND
jgi:hypothetical protein